METAARALGAWLAAAWLLPCLLVGCAYRAYPNTLAKNVEIQTQLDTGFPLLDSIRASLEIYSVDASCETRYEGTVELDDPSIPMGLPVEEPSYLVFTFTRSSFLGSSRSKMRHATLFTPRRAHEYELEVRYVDDIYAVAIRETHPRSHRRREIDKRGLDACGAPS